ncbi:hypothetical protein Dimus_034305 [Dionaea muscipula]
MRRWKISNNIVILFPYVLWSPTKLVSGEGRGAMPSLSIPFPLCAQPIIFIPQEEEETWDLFFFRYIAFRVDVDCVSLLFFLFSSINIFFSTLYVRISIPSIFIENRDKVPIMLRPCKSNPSSSSHFHFHHRLRLLLLPLCLFICFTFLFRFSNAHFTQTLQYSGIVNGDGYLNNGALTWGLRRETAEVVGNSSLILAENRTFRRDPLDDFKRYAGGWNISNKHYWASVGFTAAPFFAIAAAWFVIFIPTLCIICLCCCCCQRDPYTHSRICYTLTLIFLVLFTVATIFGCIFLYTGQGKFHTSTTSTLDYVVSQANDTVDKLDTVSGYLSAAKNIGVDSITLPQDLQTKISQVQSMINTSSSTLSEKTHDNSRKIQKVLDIVRITLIVVAAVILFLAFVGSLVSVLGVQCLVYFLVILGWIIVTGTFILSGVFLLLHNVVGDTCVAMEEWVQNPTAHTALDDILPCVDNGTAQEILSRSKDVTHEIVGLIDNVITSVANVDSPSYYNQSGPLLPVLCNPFNADLSNRSCAAGEVVLQNATEVWKKSVCQVSGSDVCITTGRLTPKIYEQMSTAVNASYGLYRYTPFMVELVDCTFVRSTFGEISKTYCPGLRKYTKWIYVGLVVVSAAAVLSLMTWVIYAQERK